MTIKEIIPSAADPTMYRKVQKKRKSRLPSLTDEDLFWMKFEVGEEYINAMSVPPEQKEILKRSQEFWVWLNQMWYLIDLSIFSREKRCDLTKTEYRSIQKIRLSTYKVNRVAMQAALKEKATAKE